MCPSGLLSPPVASISTIPRSSNVCLAISGGESIFPLVMTIVVLTVRVWFEINTSASPIACVAGGIRERTSGGGAAILKPAREFNWTLHQSSHSLATRVQGFATKTKALAREMPPATQATSPITGRSSLRAFNLISDRLSATFGPFSCSFLNWYSSIMLVSEPMSGSTCVSFPLIFSVACVMCFQVLHVAFIITICGAVIAFIWEAVIAPSYHLLSYNHCFDLDTRCVLFVLWVLTQTCWLLFCHYVHRGFDVWVFSYLRVFH